MESSVASDASLGLNVEPDPLGLLLLLLLAVALAPPPPAASTSGRTNSSTTMASRVMKRKSMSETRPATTMASVGSVPIRVSARRQDG